MSNHAISIITLAARSTVGFIRLALTGRLHLQYHRLGTLYDIGDRGQFRIFRETTSSQTYPNTDVVLVVGFRLRVLGNSRLLHWLFQRVCLLTTPFWSGLRGFRVKLWMVDPATHNYLGIYDWAGQTAAQRYVDALLRVLRPLSVTGTVWSELRPRQSFENFLAIRQAAGSGGVVLGQH